MPNEGEWDENNIEELGDEGQVQDSNAIKALRAKNKADTAKITSLESQVATLVAKDQETTVAGILQTKGVNPKAARLVLKDVTEVTEANVDAWLKDNGDLLGIPAAAATTTEEVNEGSTANVELGRQDALTQQATPPGTAGNVKATIAGFKTFDEINAWAQSQQK